MKTMDKNVNFYQINDTGPCNSQTADPVVTSLIPALVPYFRGDKIIKLIIKIISLVILLLLLIQEGLRTEYWLTP